MDKEYILKKDKKEDSSEYKYLNNELERELFYFLVFYGGAFVLSLVLMLFKIKLGSIIISSLLVVSIIHMVILLILYIKEDPIINFISALNLFSHPVMPLIGVIFMLLTDSLWIGYLLDILLFIATSLMLKYLKNKREKKIKKIKKELLKEEVKKE